MYSHVGVYCVRCKGSWFGGTIEDPKNNVPDHKILCQTTTFKTPNVQQSFISKDQDDCALIGLKVPDVKTNDWEQNALGYPGWEQNDPGHLNHSDQFSGGSIQELLEDDNRSE